MSVSRIFQLLERLGRHGRGQNVASFIQAEQSEEDETAYLLKSSANRERLLKAIENVAHERNLVTVKLDELQITPADGKKRRH